MLPFALASCEDQSAASMLTHWDALLLGPPKFHCLIGCAKNCDMLHPDRHIVINPVSSISGAQEELRHLKRMALWGIFSSVMFVCGPILITLASFSTYALLGLPLTADVAFPALALFNLMRFPVLMCVCVRRSPLISISKHLNASS